MMLKSQNVALLLGICVVLLLVGNVYADEETVEGILNINFAPEEELTKIPGLEPEIAKLIVENRPYETVEGLLNIEGIDSKVLDVFNDKMGVAKLNINDATLQELLLLPGINQELAEKIINNRPYGMLDELLKISGFGEDLLNTIRGFVEVKATSSDDIAHSGYMLTQESFDGLKKERLPGNVLDALQDLQDQKFMAQDEFLNALRARLDETVVVKHSQLILKYADLAGKKGGWQPRKIFLIRQTPPVSPVAPVDGSGE